ncbi:hypothetical protein [Clostridium thermopalmarium]|uniref:7-cyano-7-deazaguanine synthase n=1 Tax=Clostridium thermopalmarium DSM 5974 TaxID=1121340 RepID=A0A2T0AZ75_9CLOT|nr:hypothetical protein [Clostridium thermopalmarium]PRR76501.1 hypothetical protein CPAL_01720 [Clostridium thermopalmarium DSM 5974]PVZ28386.1 hypothetical protein LX19_00358 [Clostridium thermopalmarium DSM 5974]
MNKMIINKVIIQNNRLDCDYTIMGEWKKYFNEKESFFIEYSKSIMDVPESIAIIPFLCNFLPMAWIFDAEIILNEIDKDFYDSINEFKQGYIEMYPKLEFAGKITAQKIVNNVNPKTDKSAAFFSGGVDAFHTLISHIDERPTLVTLWGSDIKLEDKVGWKVVEEHTVNIARDNKLDYVVVKSSFRKFLNEGALSSYVSKRTGDNWWHGFQHGIGLLGHMAPYAYQYQISKVYIASTFTIAEKGKVTCASDPSIDNYVRFCGCQVIHDGYEYNRQAKIERICNYTRKTGKPVQLRVCWESEGGSNCCHCEKCYRTILGIIAEKDDPRKYGFNYSNEDFNNMMKDFKRRIHVILNYKYIILNYKYIQDKLRNNYEINEVNNSLRWFYKMNINNINNIPIKQIFRVKRKIKNAISKIKKRMV